MQGLQCWRRVISPPTFEIVDSRKLFRFPILRPESHRTFLNQSAMAGIKLVNMHIPNIRQEFRVEVAWLPLITLCLATSAGGLLGGLRPLRNANKLDRKGVSRAFAISNNCYQNYGIKNDVTITSMLPERGNKRTLGGSEKLRRAPY